MTLRTIITAVCLTASLATFAVPASAHMRDQTAHAVAADNDDAPWEAGSKVACVVDASGCPSAKDVEDANPFDEFARRRRAQDVAAGSAEAHNLYAQFAKPAAAREPDNALVSAHAKADTTAKTDPTTPMNGCAELARLIHSLGIAAAIFYAFIVLNSIETLADLEAVLILALMVGADYALATWVEPLLKDLGYVPSFVPEFVVDVVLMLAAICIGLGFAEALSDFWRWIRTTRARGIRLADILAIMFWTSLVGVMLIGFFN